MAKIDAGGARHQRADAEGDGIDAVDLDAHQRRRRAVHAHGDDGAADAGTPHDQVEHAGQDQRQRHAEQAVDRHDDAAEVERTEIERHPPRRRGVVDRHEIVEDEVEAEGQRQRGQDRLADHAVDHEQLDHIAEREQQQRDRRQRQQRMNAVAVPGEEREVAAEDDQRAVQHVDDVEHAPHQREADREARIERAQHDSVHQGLQICPSRSRRSPARATAFDADDGSARQAARAASRKMPNPADSANERCRSRRTKHPRAERRANCHLMSDDLAVLDVGRSEHLDLLVLHLDDRQVARLVHAVGAELDRSVERADVGLGERVAHLFLVGGAGPLDRVLQHHTGRRAGGVDVVRIALLLGDELLVEVLGRRPDADALVARRLMPPARAGHAVGEIAETVDVFLVGRTRHHGDDRRLHAEVGHLLAGEDQVLGVAGDVDPVGIAGLDRRQRGRVVHGADGVELIVDHVEARALRRRRRRLAPSTSGTRRRDRARPPV